MLSRLPEQDISSATSIVTITLLCLKYTKIVVGLLASPRHNRFLAYTFSTWRLHCIVREAQRGMKHNAICSIVHGIQAS